MKGESPLIERFLRALKTDQDRSVQRSLEEYLEEFPGDAAAIRAAFEEHAEAAHEEGLSKQVTLRPRRAGAPDDPTSKSSGDLSQPGLVVGQTVGRYRLVEQVGRGGQGVVWKAVDRELGRTVAIKFLNSGVAVTHEGSRRFHQEALIASKLEHPGICGVLERGSHEGLPHLVMPFIEGTTLARRISEARGGSGDSLRLVDPPSSTSAKMDRPSGESVPRSATSSAGRRNVMEIVELIEGAARALHVAHEAGIVHRDVKPGNLMITEEGNAVLLDFGMARDERSDQATLTREQDRFGTPEYMSPEQMAEGSRGLDRRSDVFSLAVVLFEALTLRRPFEGATMASLHVAVTTEPPPRLRRLNRTVPGDLEVVIETALDKSPERRYATAEEFANELQRIRQLRPIAARRAGAGTRTLRWAQRNPVVASLTILLFMVLSTATIWTRIQAAELTTTNTALREQTRVANDREAEATAAARVAAEEARARAEALDEVRDARAAEASALRERTAVLREYQRLADTRRLTSAITMAEELWPVQPSLTEGLLDWQQRHASLLEPETLAGHRKALDQLREQAEPEDAGDRETDFARELELIEGLKAEIERLESELAAVTDEESRRVIAARIAQRRERIRGFEATVQGRRTWRFQDAGLEFRHEVLSKLVEDLEALGSRDRPGIEASIADRLTRSRRIEQMTVTGPQVEPLWTAAIARVKDNDTYALTAEERAVLGEVCAPASLFDQEGRLLLPPQVGLIPLGPDPRSGLEEFLHLETHAYGWDQTSVALPSRRPITDEESRGGLKVAPETGVVLVLIPASRSLIGTQNTDPDAPNHDPRHARNEGPVQEVSLAPFFISKYEMTQAQWTRSSSRVGIGRLDPNKFTIGAFAGKPNLSPKPIDGTHPVESVDCLTAAELARRVGLTLPTEAQWEYAARARRPDAIWSGATSPQDMRRYANIAGAETRGVTPWENWSKEHRDPYVAHAPVGSFLPNAFGIHDMTGNVSEWCRDSYWLYHQQSTNGPAGLRGAIARDRVCRGGSFSNAANTARIGQRYNFSSTLRNAPIGFRTARALSLP